MLIYKGAVTVPMAHPFGCRKCYWLKLINISMCLIKIAITSVEGSLFYY